MSSPYPVLDNRPIDHWKVTELKEELKRRKLTTKGLKDDLVKRLAEDLRVENEKKEALLIERGNAEALRVETENADKNVDNGIDGVVVAEPDPSLGEMAGNIVDSGVTQKKKADDVSIEVHTESAAALGHGDVKEGDTFVGSDSARVEANVVVRTTVVETITTISESVISEVALAGQHFPNTETQKENGNSKPHPKYEDSKPLLDGDVLMSKPEDEGIESTDRIVIPETSPLNNQVLEVSLTSGFQVKSDSISPDSVSVNEKIELKDNIIADNVKVELDIVKPEMVEPSSSNVDPVPGESHTMNVEEPKEKKTYIEGEDDSNNAANTDMNTNNQTVDVGYSEKLNLDRSSGDDSMEEDLLETRQIDSKDDSDDVVARGEKTEIPLANEETHVDVVGGGLSLDNDINAVSMNHAAATLVNKENPIGMPAEKRRLNDQGLGSTVPLKRQRRWNTESVKIPESRSPNLTPTTPKNAFQSTALKRNFSVSGSKSSEDAPKERVVPPSPKSPTKSLRIDHFVRPFTLKAVQELLGKNGTVAKFWMDQIKTHCFVTYSSVEEAIETRNAVYNLQWPPNGGRLLVAEFVEPQEVTQRADAPQAPAAPVKAGPTTLSAPPAAAQPVPSPRQPVPRHQPLPPPPPLPSTNLSPPREHLPPPPPLPLDPPIATLDDLFRKTKASPWIYYLPLSEKEVAAKLAARGKKQQA